MAWTKPQLANDADLDTVTYPCGVQPKIDGVRALNLEGTLTGRSLDPFTGFGITDYWSKPEFTGLDGEMILGHDPASSDRLCSLTTGAMTRFKDTSQMADLTWWVFDYLTPETIGKRYIDRYNELVLKCLDLNHPRIKHVPMQIVQNRQELDKAIADYFEQGYEGTIIRNLTAAYKPGRPGKRVQELVRVKPWIDAEILVTGVTEGEENQNEAIVNTLGRTERSSAQDGKVPNGLIGSIQGTLLADVHDPFTDRLLFAKGLPVTVSKGCLTLAEAKHYFENQSEIVGHIVKFKSMSHGVKDLPRFAGYLSHRAKEDMS